MSGHGSHPPGRTRRQRQAHPPQAEQKVKLTIEKKEQLRARASELGVSVPRLMVEAALSGVETPAERRAWIAELFELRRLAATVANNVNQLARIANICVRPRRVRADLPRASCGRRARAHYLHPARSSAPSDRGFW